PGRAGALAAPRAMAHRLRRRAAQPRRAPPARRGDRGRVRAAFAQSGVGVRSLRSPGVAALPRLEHRGGAQGGHLGRGAPAGRRDHTRHAAAGRRTGLVGESNVALVRGEGIVLKTHALGDTSRIVVVYMRDQGLTRLVAKGARKTPSRFGFALEPLSRGSYVFYYKPDRDLHLLSQADTLAPTGSRIADLARLAHAEAALELVDKLVWGEEPHAELYDLLAMTLESIAAAPEASL